TEARLEGLLRGPETDLRAAEGAPLLDTYSRSGPPAVVLVKKTRLTALLIAAHRGNALPIVNGNQDGLVDEVALKRVLAATDRLPEGTVVLTESTFMSSPAKSFAQIDPITDKFRFGDYFIARSYAALAERFELRVLERGRFGYVVL